MQGGINPIAIAVFFLYVLMRLLLLSKKGVLPPPSEWGKAFSSTPVSAVQQQAQNQSAMTFVVLLVLGCIFAVVYMVKKYGLEKPEEKKTSFLEPVNIQYSKPTPKPETPPEPAPVPEPQPAAAPRPAQPPDEDAGFVDLIKENPVPAAIAGAVLLFMVVDLLRVGTSAPVPRYSEPVTYLPTTPVASVPAASVAAATVPAQATPTAPLTPAPPTEPPPTRPLTAKEKAKADFQSGDPARIADALQHGVTGRFKYRSSMVARYLAQHPDTEVAEVAVKILAKRKGEGVDKALVYHYRSGGAAADAAFAALQARGKKLTPSTPKDPEAIQTAAMGEERRRSTFDAIKQLQYMEGDEATKVLDTLRKDRSSKIRRAARRAWSMRVAAGFVRDP